MTISV